MCCPMSGMMQVPIHSASPADRVAKATHLLYCPPKWRLGNESPGHEDTCLASELLHWCWWPVVLTELQHVTQAGGLCVIYGAISSLVNYRKSFQKGMR